MPRLQDEKLEAFAHHYIERYSAEDAARAAGLTEAKEPQSAVARANLALLRPDVGRRIRELNDAKLRKVDATSDRVMQELSRVSFNDVRRLFNERGHLLPIGEVDNDTAAAVKAVKVERHRAKNGYEIDLMTGRRVPVYEDYETVEIKMHDKVATLGILAKHFKIIGDESDGINAIASALADRLKGARTRVLTRHPLEEIEDARLKHPDVPGHAAVAGGSPPVQESGDGDRSDPDGLG